MVSTSITLLQQVIRQSRQIAAKQQKMSIKEGNLSNKVLEL